MWKMFDPNRPEDFAELGLLLNLVEVYVFWTAICLTESGEILLNFPCALELCLKVAWPWMAPSKKHRRLFDKKKNHVKKALVSTKISILLDHTQHTRWIYKTNTRVTRSFPVRYFHGRQFIWFRSQLVSNLFIEWKIISRGSNIRRQNNCLDQCI